MSGKEKGKERQINKVMSGKVKGKERRIRKEKRAGEG